MAEWRTVVVSAMMQVSLLSCDLVLLELVLQDPAALEERFGVRIASEWEDFAGAMRVSLDKLRAKFGADRLVDTLASCG
jgi:hypothetical protein